MKNIKLKFRFKCIRIVGASTKITSITNSKTVLLIFRSARPFYMFGAYRTLTSHSLPAINAKNAPVIKLLSKGKKEPWEPACLASFRGLVTYSHSIVAGGFDVQSSTTRLMPFTSLMIRLEILSRTSYGIRAQSAVIPSIDVTARIPTVYSYVR